MSAGGAPANLLVTLLRSPIVWALLMVAVLNFDPFGIGRATSAQSQAIFDRIFTVPAYPPGTGAEEQQRLAATPVSVVLVDEGYVQYAGEGRWPLRYKTQLSLLKEIVDWQPRAIFLDFLYRYRHDDEDAFQALLHYITQDARAAGVPIYLPVLLSGDGRFACSRPFQDENIELTDQSSILKDVNNDSVRKVFVGWSGCGDRMPLLINGQLNSRTPAMAMYRQLCADRLADSLKEPKNPNLTDFEKDLDASCEADLAEFRDPMNIQWGITATPLHRAIIQGQGQFCPPLESRAQAVGFSLKQLWAMLASAFSDSRLPPTFLSCLQVDTFNASYFDERSRIYEALDANPDYVRMGEPFPPEAFITDRYVFVGSGLDMVDRMENHLYESIPGVYNHAMAMHNLVHWGRKYVREMGKFYQILVEALGAILVVLAFQALMGRLDEPHRPYQLVLLVIAKLLAPFVIALLYMWCVVLFYGVLFDVRVSVGDWLGVGAIAGLVARYSLADLKNDIFEYYNLKQPQEVAGNASPEADGPGQDEPPR